MRFTSIIYAGFAATALAAPTTPVGTSQELAARQGLLQDLSPGIALLVTGLGLPAVGHALSDTLITLSRDLKKRDGAVEESQFDERGPVLSDLAPDVAELVTSLGLGALAPGLAALLQGLSTGL